MWYIETVVSRDWFQLWDQKAKGQSRAVYVVVFSLICHDEMSCLCHFNLVNIQYFYQMKFQQGVANQSKRCAMCRQEIPADFLDHPTLLSSLEAEKEEVLPGGYQWFYEGRNGKPLIVCQSTVFFLELFMLPSQLYLDLFLILSRIKIFDMLLLNYLKSEDCHQVNYIHQHYIYFVKSCLIILLDMQF